MMRGVRPAVLSIAVAALLAACGPGTPKQPPPGGEATAPGAPFNVVGSPDDGAVTLNFSAPKLNGGSPITRYIATATPGGFTGTNDGTSTTLKVSGLTNGASYTFVVAAENAIGRGPNSQPSGPITPGRAPAAPTGVSAQRGNGAAQVSWSAVTDDGGSAVTSYVVTISPAPSVGSDTLTIAPPVPHATFTALTNGTAYTFTVAATNAFGTGPASTPSEPVTPADVPEAPTNLTGTPGDGQVSLFWIAPVQTGGLPINDYMITTSPGGAQTTVLGTATSAVVTGLSNGTAYTFTVAAENDVGASLPATSSAITPAGVPSAPTSVSATRGNGQVSVSWVAPSSNGGSAITGYLVSSTPDGITASAGANATSAVVSGLTNGTSYTFRVAALNAIGTGTPSSPSAAVIPADVPGAPTNVAGVRGDGQVSLSWTAPTQTGGLPINDYLITTNPGGAQTTVTGAQTTVVIGSLTNGSAYTFSVAAVNDVGPGLAGTSASVTPARRPDAPTSPVAVRGNSQASVSWTAPAFDGGSPITSYVVTSSPEGHQATVAGNVTTAIVNGLTNGTAYTFSVVAVNDVGPSPKSPDSNSITPAAVPSAPTNFVATRGDGQVSLAWAAPTDTGSSALTGYTLTGTPGGISQTLSASATSTVVGGLTNGTAYSFSLIASNAVGDSVAATAGPVTPATVPSQPTNVSATAGNQQATVTWTAPSSNGGSAISSYTVVSSPGGVTKVVGATATSAVVSGLTNGTAYTFVVFATNAVGNGANSDPSAAVTPATVPTAPTNVTATAGNQKATVSWSAPANDGGSAILSYTVTSSTGTFTATVSAPTTTVDVTGLVNGTSYSFTVKATNAVGSSVASTSSNSVVPATTPGAPTITSVVRGNQQVTVTWAAPSSNGGLALSGYTVTSTPDGKTATVSGTTLTAAVTGLTNGTTYTFTVHATNALGDGPESATSSSVTPATVPGAPTNVTATAGQQSASLSWTAPTSDGGSALTGYKITTSPATTTTTVSAGTTNTTLSGLTAGTAYTFTVVATNAVGSSTGATSNAVTPTAAPPDAPTNAYATIDDGQAQVFWTAPSNNGGSPITGYTVTSSPGGVVVNAGASATSATVTTLTDGTSYTFTIVANNAYGSSPQVTTNAVKPTSCTLCQHTYRTSVVNSNNCAVLYRDTTSCQASRIAAGFSGFWLKFSCRVTLTKTTVNMRTVYQVSSDNQPDYQSFYFPTTDVCYEAWSAGHHNPYDIIAKTVQMNIPASPSGTPQTTKGTVGMAVNGVEIFDNAAAPGDDIYQEATTFDRCGAHPQQAGTYHYHCEPYAISNDDDNFIGIMRDGYPIYGRRDPDGTVPSTAGALDSYGGHTGYTVDSPNTAVYHYHVNLQTSTNSGTLGQQQWFISAGPYKATPGMCVSGC